MLANFAFFANTNASSDTLITTKFKILSPESGVYVYSHSPIQVTAYANKSVDSLELSISATPINQKFKYNLYPNTDNNDLPENDLPPEMACYFSIAAEDSSFAEKYYYQQTIRLPELLYQNKNFSGLPQFLYLKAGLGTIGWSDSVSINIDWQKSPSKWILLVPVLGPACYFSETYSEKPKWRSVLGLSSFFTDFFGLGFLIFGTCKNSEKSGLTNSDFISLSQNQTVNLYKYNTNKMPKIENNYSCLVKKNYHSSNKKYAAILLGFSLAYRIIEAFSDDGGKGTLANEFNTLKFMSSIDFISNFCNRENLAGIGFKIYF